MSRRALAALLWGGLLLCCAPAFGQSAQEPLDLPHDGEVMTFQGRLPFHVGDRSNYSQPNLDDSAWPTVQVPGYWHAQGLGRSDRTAWYRVHLRLPQAPSEPIAVLLPPLSMASQVFLNGERIAHSGLVEGRAPGAWREARSLVPLDAGLLRVGDNVLALRLVSGGGLGGAGGPLRFGSEAELRRLLGIRGMLTGGLLWVFLMGGAFLLLVWSVNRADRQTLWFALSLLVISGMTLASNEHWYLFFESTEWKLRLRHALRYAAHGTTVTFAARSFGSAFERPARTLLWTSLSLAAACLLGPLGIANELAGMSWLLTLAGLLYVLDLARALPVRSPVVRSGVRAALVGALIALVYEVASGVWDTPGPGPFELAFLPVLVALSGAIAMRTGLAHLQASRVVSAARDGIGLLRAETRVELTNPALQGLLGRSAGEIMREGLAPSFSEAEWARLREALRRLAVAGPSGSPALFELEVTRVGGKLLVEVLGAALDDDHLLLSFRDVTRRRDLEREAARAQRLDSLGMLAGGIAHDFNNLMAGILASATDLEPGASIDDAERHRRVSTILESARRGGSLTQRLLHFAQGRMETPLGVDLEVKVPSLVDMLGRTLGRKISWSLDIEPDLPAAALDESELEQILVNLCVNARDAMASRGGSISIRARSRTHPEGERVELQVLDSGPGMPRELLDRVFEPFVTTKGSGAGTGLGLAVVYGIVNRRGGRVSIESKEGEGTSVTVLVPTAPDSVTSTLPPEDVAAPVRPGLRALLVDDEPALRTFLASALERRGLLVQTLQDGQAALGWLEEAGDECPVDVVIMDMQMPVVDGMEATTALRERWPGLPVVISSGYAGQESIEPLEKTGPTLVLEKPYQVEDLVRALGRVTSS